MWWSYALCRLHQWNKERCSIHIISIEIAGWAKHTIYVSILSPQLKNFNKSIICKGNHQLYNLPLVKVCGLHFNGQTKLECCWKMPDKNSSFQIYSSNLVDLLKNRLHRAVSLLHTVHSLPLSIACAFNECQFISMFINVFQCLSMCFNVSHLVIRRIKRSNLPRTLQLKTVLCFVRYQSTNYTHHKAANSFDQSVGWCDVCACGVCLYVCVCVCECGARDHLCVHNNSTIC